MLSLVRCTTIKGLVLDDDSLNTNISINFDYNKNVKDNLYLNSGISLVKHSTTDTTIYSMVSK